MTRAAAVGIPPAAAKPGRCYRVQPEALRWRSTGPGCGHRRSPRPTWQPRATAMTEPAGPAPAYAAVDLIRAKRDGVALTGDEIRWLIGAYLSGEVADEQMSAMLMAVYFRGLGDAELRSWTSAMVDSGERLDLGSLTRPTVDKHSTGGVGDKVSLILAPLVA